MHVFTHVSVTQHLKNDSELEGRTEMVEDNEEFELYWRRRDRKWEDPRID